MPRPRHKNKAIIGLSSHPSHQSLCFDSKLVVVVVVIGLMETRLKHLRAGILLTMSAMPSSIRALLRLQLHGVIYRPGSFLLMLCYCASLKAIRYESMSLNRIVADKSHRVIVGYTVTQRFMTH